MNAPHELTASEAVAAIAAGTLTAETLVASCLERIAERDDAVRAWAFIDRDGALAAARVADRAGTQGLLHGVPVGLKDIIDTFDMPTGYNSPIYAGHRPSIDAACAALLRNAGAVILGKTVTTEFANRFPGDTRHPLAPSHTPGGSSSGSAAAVADRQVPLSLGTQTSGSLIRPAAYCGVVGYKPTFNSISRVGVKQQSGSLDTVGLMARSIEDIVLLRAALLADPHRALSSHPRPRLGLCRTPQWGEADAATQTLVEDVARRCERAGASLREVALPDALFGDNPDVHRRLANFEGARNFAHEKHTHPELISDALLEGRIRDGERVCFESYVDAQRQAEAMREWLETLFGDYDALLTPAAPGEAPAGLGFTGAAIFNSLWTMLYVPCITLPAGVGRSGLPLGVQVIGPRYGDERLLAAAMWIREVLE